MTVKFLGIGHMDEKGFAADFAVFYVVMTSLAWVNDEAYGLKAVRTLYPGFFFVHHVENHVYQSIFLTANLKSF